MQALDGQLYPDMLPVEGGTMAVDAALRAELIEARDRIIAQLDEIQFRATAKGFARRGGPPAYGQIYAELKNELCEINELLEPSDDQESDQR